MLAPHEIFRFDKGGARGEGESIIVDWRIPQNLPYFAGHFPGDPVLPAVALIDGSCECVRQATGETGPLTNIKVAKFTGVLRPEMAVKIHLLPLGNKEWRVRWESVAGENAGMVMADLTVLF